LKLLSETYLSAADHPIPRSMLEKDPHMVAAAARDVGAVVAAARVSSREDLKRAADAFTSLLVLLAGRSPNLAAALLDDTLLLMLDALEFLVCLHSGSIPSDCHLRTEAWPDLARELRSRAPADLPPLPGVHDAVLLLWQGRSPLRQWVAFSSLVLAALPADVLLLAEVPVLHDVASAAATWLASGDETMVATTASLLLSSLRRLLSVAGSPCMLAVPWGSLLLAAVNTRPKSTQVPGETMQLLLQCTTDAVMSGSGPSAEAALKGALSAAPSWVSGGQLPAPLLEPTLLTLLQPRVPQHMQAAAWKCTLQLLSTGAHAAAAVGQVLRRQLLRDGASCRPALAQGAEAAIVQACHGSSILASGCVSDEPPSLQWGTSCLHGALLYVLCGAMQVTSAPHASGEEDASPPARCNAGAKLHAEHLMQALSESSLPCVAKLSEALPSGAAAPACAAVAAQLFLAIQETVSWKTVERLSHAFLLRCVPVCRDVLQDLCVAAEGTFEGGGDLSDDAASSAAWAMQVSSALLRTYTYDKVQRLTAPSVAASLAVFRAIAGSQGGRKGGDAARTPTPPPTALHSHSALEESCTMHMECVRVSACSSSDSALAAQPQAVGLMQQAVQLLLLLAPQAIRETVRRVSTGRAAVVAGFNDASALINKAAQSDRPSLASLLSGPYEPSAMVETRKLLSHTLVCAAHIALTWIGQPEHKEALQGIVTDVFSQLCACVLAALVEVAVTYDAPVALASSMQSCLLNHEDDMLNAAQNLSDFRSEGGRVLNGKPVDGRGSAAVCRSLAACVFAWRQNTLVAHVRWCQGVLTDLAEAILSPHSAVCSALQHALVQQASKTQVYAPAHCTVACSLPAAAAAQVGTACSALFRQTVMCCSLNAMRSCVRAAPISEHRRICEHRAAASSARGAPNSGRKRPRRGSDAGATAAEEGGDAFSGVCDAFISGTPEPPLAFSAVSTVSQGALQRAVQSVFSQLRSACDRTPLQEQDCHPMSSADAAAAFVLGVVNDGAHHAPASAHDCMEWSLVGAQPKEGTQLGAANGQAALFVGDAASSNITAASTSFGDAEPEVLVVEDGLLTGGAGGIETDTFFEALVASCHSLRQCVVQYSGASSLLVSVQHEGLSHFWNAGGSFAACATEAVLQQLLGALQSFQLPARRGVHPKHWQPQLMQAVRCGVQAAAAANLLIAAAAAGSAPQVAACGGVARLTAALNTLGQALAWLHVVYLVHGTESLLGADLVPDALEGNPILAVEEFAALPVQAAAHASSSGGNSNAPQEKRPRSDTGDARGSTLDSWSTTAAQVLSEGGWYAWLQQCSSDLLAVFAEFAPRTLTVRLLCTDAPRLPDAATCLAVALSEIQLSVSAWWDVSLQAEPKAAQHGSGTVTARQVACTDAILWRTLLYMGNTAPSAQRADLADACSQSQRWCLWRPSALPTSKPDRAGNIARLESAMTQVDSPASLSLISQALSALTLRARPMSIDALGDFAHFRDPHTAPQYAQLRVLEAALEGCFRSMRQGATGPSLRAAAAARQFVAARRPKVAPLRWGVPLHLALFADQHARFMSSKLLRDTAGAVFAVHIFQSTAAMASVGDRRVSGEGDFSMCRMPAVLTVTELVTSVCTFWLPGLFLLSGRSRTAALTAFAALLVPVMVPVQPSVDAPVLQELVRHRVATGKSAVHRALQHALNMRMRTLACHCMVRILVCLTGSGGTAVSALQALGSAMNAQTNMAPEAASATACTLLSRFVVTTLELLVWQLGDGSAPFAWRVVQALCVAGNSVLTDESKHSPLPAYINMEEIAEAFGGRAALAGAASAAPGSKRSRVQRDAPAAEGSFDAALMAFSQAGELAADVPIDQVGAKVRRTSLRSQAVKMSKSQSAAVSAGRSDFVKLLPLVYLADVRFMAIITRVWVQVLTSQELHIDQKRRALQSMRRFLVWLPPGVTDRQMNSLLSALKIAFKNPQLRVPAMKVWYSVVQQLSGDTLEQYCTPLVVSMHEAAAEYGATGSNGGHNDQGRGDHSLPLVPHRDMPGFLFDATPQGLACTVTPALPATRSGSVELSAHSTGDMHVDMPREDVFMQWVWSMCSLCEESVSSALGAIPAHPHRILEHPLFLRCLASACDAHDAIQHASASGRRNARGIAAHFKTGSQAEQLTLANRAELLTPASALRHALVAIQGVQSADVAVAALHAILRERLGDVSNQLGSLPTLMSPAPGVVVLRDLVAANLAVESHRSQSSGRSKRRAEQEFRKFSRRVEALLQHASSENEDVSLAALRELGTVFDASSGELAEGVLGDGDFGMTQIVSTVVTRLVQLSRGAPGDAVRIQVARRLGQLGAVDPSRLSVLLNNGISAELSEGDLCVHIIKTFLRPGIFSAAGNVQLNGYSAAVQEVLGVLGGLLGVLDQKQSNVARGPGAAGAGSASVVSTSSYNNHRAALSMRGEVPLVLAEELGDDATISDVASYWSSAFTMQDSEPHKTHSMHAHMQQHAALPWPYAPLFPQFVHQERGFNQWLANWVAWGARACVALACHKHPQAFSLHSAVDQPQDILASQAQMEAATSIFVDIERQVPVFAPHTPRLVLRAALWKALMPATAIDQRLQLFTLPYIMRDLLAFGFEFAGDGIAREIRSVLTAVASSVGTTSAQHQAAQVVFNLLDTMDGWATGMLSDLHFLGGYRIRSDGVTRLRLRSVAVAKRFGNDWARYWVPSMGPAPTHRQQSSQQRKDLPAHLLTSLERTTLDEMDTFAEHAKWLTGTGQMSIAVLTQASLRIGAHARAVRYWEQHLRNKSGSRYSSALVPGVEGQASGPVLGGVVQGQVPYSRAEIDMMQKIHAQLDEPDGLAGFSALRSQWMIEHEHAGGGTAVPATSVSIVITGGEHVLGAGAVSDDEDAAVDEVPAPTIPTQTSLALLGLQESIIESEKACRWGDALLAYDHAIELLAPHADEARTSMTALSMSGALDVVSLSLPACHAGALRCLIQQGHEDTALLRGITVLQQLPAAFSQLYPIAVELCWRLQRWVQLEHLLGPTRGLSPAAAVDVQSAAAAADGTFPVAQARGMLAVHKLQSAEVQQMHTAQGAADLSGSGLSDWSILHEDNAVSIPLGSGAWVDALCAGPAQQLSHQPPLGWQQGGGKAAVHSEPDAVHSALRLDLESAVDTAALDVMASLSAAASESHTRAYSHLVRLHGLWEMLQGASWSSSNDSQQALLQSHWGERMQATLPSLSVREPLLAARRVLLSIHGMRREEHECLVELAATARNEDSFETAAAALGRASRHTSTAARAQLELGKLLYDQGQQDRALRILEPVEVNLDALVAAAAATTDGDEREELVMPYLMATKWLAEGHLSPEQLVRRYKKVIEASPHWEESRYAFAVYQDRIAEALNEKLQLALLERGRAAAHSPRIAQLTKDRDAALVAAMRHYHKSVLQRMQNHTHETMPRLLTLYFDYGAALAKSGATGSSTGAAAGTSAMGSDKYKAPSKAAFDVMSRYMEVLRRDLKAFIWMLVLQQLASRICHRHEAVVAVLEELLQVLTMAYPAQVMWTLVGLAASRRSPLRRERAQNIIARLKQLEVPGQRDLTPDLVCTHNVVKDLIKTAEVLPPQGTKRIEVSIGNFRTLESVELCMPTSSFMTLSLHTNSSGSMDIESPANSSSVEAAVKITKFDTSADVMSSKEKPKKVSCVGSDGRRYYFLCKRERRGDLRKDSRMMEYCTTLNRLWRADPDGQRRGVAVSTYFVVCLNEESGIMEWLNGTSGFRQEVTSVYTSLKRSDPMLRTREVRSEFDSLQKDVRISLPDKVVKYRSSIRRKFPAVFHQWYLHRFTDPSAWFEARTRFVRTSAAWSMAGHIIGLGDRHGENLLLNTRTGACAHVDFDCLFDKGLTLSTPEIVPFRLTPNMLDAMGVSGYEGAFRRVSEVALGTLRSSRSLLLAQLESFIHDPLVEWGRSDKQPAVRTRDNGDIPASLVGGESVNFNGVRMVGRIEQRLSGHYNVGAGFTDTARVTGIRSPDDARRASASSNDLLGAGEMAGGGLNVSGHVDRLLREATDDANLLRMYIGWMPFL